MSPDQRAKAVRRPAARPPAVWSPLVVAFLASGCGHPAPAPAPSEDVLILELGGHHKALADSLRHAGVVPESPPAATPPADPPQTGSPPAPRPPDDPSTPTLPPRWVELGPGQTISDLAREHLGDANRWQDILQANGWTERQARRLRPGTRVKLP